MSALEFEIGYGFRPVCCRIVCGRRGCVLLLLLAGWLKCALSTRDSVFVQACAELGTLRAKHCKATLAIAPSDTIGSHMWQMNRPMLDTLQHLGRVIASRRVFYIPAA